MNRTEKEQYIIQLYKENRSTREIAGLVHMSFRDIDAITKKVKLKVKLKMNYATLIVILKNGIANFIYNLNLHTHVGYNS